MFEVVFEVIAFLPRLPEAQIGQIRCDYGMVEPSHPP